MKKIMLFVPLAAAVVAMVSCSQVRQWGETERQVVRDEIRTMRDRQAIIKMEDANYQNLEQCVVSTVEQTYPDYNKFDKLTGKKDTLNTIMINCFGYSLGQNFENLPLLFPAKQMQESGILSASLTPEQIQDFYACLSTKMKSMYNSPQQFLSAMFNEPGIPTGLTAAIQECANATNAMLTKDTKQPTPPAKK